MGRNPPHIASQRVTSNASTAVSLLVADGFLAAVNSTVKL